MERGVGARPTSKALSSLQNEAVGRIVTVLVAARAAAGLTMQDAPTSEQAAHLLTALCAECQGEVFSAISTTTVEAFVEALREAGECDGALALSAFCSGVDFANDRRRLGAAFKKARRQVEGHITELGGGVALAAAWEGGEVFPLLAMGPGWGGRTTQLQRTARGARWAMHVMHRIAPTVSAQRPQPAPTSPHSCPLTSHLSRLHLSRLHLSP